MTSYVRLDLGRCSVDVLRRKKKCCLSKFSLKKQTVISVLQGDGFETCLEQTRLV